MIVGHSISTVDGIILAVDESVSAILRRTQKQLVGISYMSITHADDLARNISHIAALRPNAGSIRIRKRYIDGEGGTIALDVSVSRLGGPESGFLVGTLSTIDAPGASVDTTRLSRMSLGCSEPIDRARERDPRELWQRANDLLDVARARDTSFGWDLCADHAWTMLLLTYVAEAESRIATAATIAAELQISRGVVDRWVRVLQSKRLFEHLPGGVDALQLTQFGLDRIERLLAEHIVTRVS